MAEDGEAVVVETIKCAFCDTKKRIMKLCTQCRAIIYCSRECQIKDWQKHKKKCCIVNLEAERIKAKQESLSKEKVLEDRHEKQCVVEEQIPQYSNQDIKYCQITNMQESITLEKGEKKLPISSKKECLEEELKGDKIVNSEIISIFIKHNKEKKKLEVIRKSKNNNSAFHQISNFLRIPVSKMKLIHKGEMVIPDNINSYLNNGALFLAFGEMYECEEGLNKTDIDILMKQLHVERNVAIKALRQKGTLLDAIFDLGNRL